MQAFAVQYVQALTEGLLPIRLQDIATSAGVTAQTVSEWRNQTPGFNEWLGLQLSRYVAHTWPAVKAVAVRMALRGSIDHMKFLKELIEPSNLKPNGVPQPGGSDGKTTGVGIFAGAIIVNLPQPPSELEGHPFVRGLLDSAQTFDAVATPGT